MAYSLGWQRRIVVLGFLSVAVGWTAYTADVWDHTPPTETLANVLFGLGGMLGYAVLAGAAWSWLQWMESCPVPLGGMSRVLRLFGVANLFLCAGVAAVAYNFASHVVTWTYTSHWEIVGVSSYGLQFLGFLLVSVAYWSASFQVSRVNPGALTPDAALVPS